MPAGILEVISLKAKPAAGSMSAAGFWKSFYA